MKNKNHALPLALEMLRTGKLSIDRQGQIWRHGFYSHGTWRTCEKRRAENIGGKGYFRLTLSKDGKLARQLCKRTPAPASVV